MEEFIAEEDRANDAADGENDENHAKCSATNCEVPSSLEGEDGEADHDCSGESDRLNNLRKLTVMSLRSQGLADFYLQL